MASAASSSHGTASRAPTFLSGAPGQSFDFAYLLMDAIAGHSTSKLRAAAGRYREARRSLHIPASAQSRRGLDWMNFFIADVQTGFGSFVAFYLAQLGWSPSHIGLALSVGGVAGMLSQIPGGALADAVTWKRGLAAAGIVMTGAAALIFAFAPDMLWVFIAQALQGATAGIITPAIGAISLGLVGRSGMSVRTGRNFRYSAVGHALTGALMCVAGAYIAKGAIFLAAAALCIPALTALSFVRSDEIDYARARNAKSTKQSDAKGSASKQAGGQRAVTATSILALTKNRKLVLFTAAIVLFQLADTSMLPMMGANLATTRGDHAAIWMSGLIVVPQVVVAILALGRISFGEKRPAAASSDRLCARACARIFARRHCRLSGTGAGASLERRDRCSHRRIDRDRRCRPNCGHGAIQSCHRRARRVKRHRRFNQHDRHRLFVSVARTASRLCATRGRCRASHGDLVDVPHRNKTEEIRRLEQSATHT